MGPIEMGLAEIVRAISAELMVFDGSAEDIVSEAMKQLGLEARPVQIALAPTFPVGSFAAEQVEAGMPVHQRALRVAQELCIGDVDATSTLAPSTAPAASSAKVLGGDVRPKRAGELPFWCSDGLEPLRELVSGAAGSGDCRGALRRRALVRALVEDGGLVWGCEWAGVVAKRIRQSLLRLPSGGRDRDSHPDIADSGDDFRDSLVVISFGAAGGGFQLSQDLRRFMLGYLGWGDSVIYHDYASLVGHPQSRLVTGADGATKQLNDNWNLYFSNALEASPVMVVVASEAWCGSAWCALERRQRMEVLAAKQAPGGPAAYEPTAASRPEAAGTAGTAGIYLERQAELEAELERRKEEWDRSARSMADVNESVFRAIAFGNRQARCEVFLFTDDPHSAEASSELQQIHSRVPECQRFYYFPGMSAVECALELHSLCVRVTELIDDQATREAFGSGDAMYAMIMSDEMPSVQHELLLRQHQQQRTGLWRLRKIADNDAAVAEAAAMAEQAAERQSCREDALRRGLVFDTGPCPF